MSHVRVTNPRKRWPHRQERATYSASGASGFWGITCKGVARTCKGVASLRPWTRLAKLLFRGSRIPNSDTGDWAGGAMLCEKTTVMQEVVTNPTCHQPHLSPTHGCNSSPTEFRLQTPDFRLVCSDFVFAMGTFHTVLKFSNRTTEQYLDWWIFDRAKWTVRQLCWRSGPTACRNSWTTSCRAWHQR